MTQHTYPAPDEDDYSSFNHNGNDTEEVSTGAILESTPNWVLMGTLIGLMTVFTILLCAIDCSSIYHYLRRKDASVSRAASTTIRNDRRVADQ